MGVPCTNLISKCLHSQFAQLREELDTKRGTESQKKRGMLWAKIHPKDARQSIVMINDSVPIWCARFHE